MQSQRDDPTWMLWRTDRLTEMTFEVRVARQGHGTPIFGE